MKKEKQAILEMRIELATPFSAKEIAETVGARIPAAEERLISAVTTDSRLVLPGDLFVALKGERSDGHYYLPEAVADRKSVV